MKYVFILTANDFRHVDLDLRVNHVTGATNVPFKSGGRRIVIREKPENGDRNSVFSEFVNPRLMFLYGNRTLYEIIEATRRRIEKRSIQAGQAVTQSGLNVMIKQEFKSGETLSVLVDKSRPYLPVSADLQIDGRGFGDSATWQTSKSGEVWVPSRVVFSQRDENGGLAHQKTVNIVESATNVPIGEDAFSYSAMGVEDGDLLDDRIAGTIFVFLNGLPIGEEEYSKALARRKALP